MFDENKARYASDICNHAGDCAANNAPSFKTGHVVVGAILYQPHHRVSFQQKPILYSATHSQATFPIFQSISNIRATMPPKRAVAAREAKSTSKNPGNYSGASKAQKAVKNVSAHKSIYGIVTTDIKLTYRFSGKWRKQQWSREGL